MDLINKGLNFDHSLSIVEFITAIESAIWNNKLTEAEAEQIWIKVSPVLSRQREKITTLLCDSNTFRWDPTSIYKKKDMNYIEKMENEKPSTVQDSTNFILERPHQAYMTSPKYTKEGHHLDPSAAQ